MKKIGRYDVLNELGHGAMGVVYAAEDPLIGRTVAIKTIRFGTPEAGDDRAQLVQRLHREAQAAGVLSHSGIITIYDVGEQEDEAYIVMEFVDGKSVEEMLDSSAPPHPETYLSLLRGTAGAIDYAHRKGIIHRDIKPSNIMVCRDGTVKIADFGIAKLSAANSLTQAGFVVGTPSYMSPEQAQGRAVDGRSDQFSLAVVGFRMLTGKLPFEGSTLTALLAKILWEEPEYESAGMNPAIRPVFKRALSKDPQLRFPTCGDFVRGLEEAFSASESALLAAIPSMTQQSDASAGFNAGLPGSSKAAAIPLEASAFGQGSVPRTASGTTPSWDVPGAGDNKPDSRSPSVVPESAARARKRKFLLITGASSLTLIALVLIAIFAFKPSQKPAASVQNGNIDAAAALKESASDVTPPSDQSGRIANPAGAPAPQASPVQPPPASGALASREERKKSAIQAAAEQKQTKIGMTAQAAPAQLNPDRVASPEVSVARQRQLENLATPLQAASGILTWSGELERNSILVITEQMASIGIVAGQFPGKPIKIEVEPKSLIIRQMPGEANRWSQIIFYSGNQRYTSITIRWNIVK